jgi:hypothetical protein
VWNRQRTDTELADPANVTLGHKSVQRWNLPGGWVISSRPAHPALVSEADFVAAQAINAGADVRADVSPGEVIGYLREHEITLTWDPATAALKARTAQTAKTVTVTAR